jgi:hypothetical protein
MRKKSSNGIIIRTPITKSLSKNGFTPYINFNNTTANIIILSYQPGFGKTYNALKYMKQQHNKNTFYFTNRHDTIDERIQDWDKKKKPLPTHWMGFDKICPDRNKKSQYKTYKISPSKLCNGCMKKHICIYVKQFKVNERVFSPTEYLSKDQFKNKISQIKTIFVDERVAKVDIREINKKQVTDAFKTIEVPRRYITDINRRNYQAFTSRKLNHLMDCYWRTIDTALSTNDKKTLEILKDFNPSSFKEYLEWGNIYNFNRDRYGIPFYYYVFDTLNINPDLKVVILDASYKRQLFKYFLYSYNGEKGFNSNIIVQEYTTNETNKDTIVFRMRPKAWHPKASFISKYEEKYAEDWVPQHLSTIRNIFGDENVGIITFKEQGERSKFLGFNVEYYGNLRSKNTFEDKPVLVILGHFFPPMQKGRIDPKTGIKQKGLEDTIEEWFLRDPSTYSMVELKAMIFKKYGKKTKRTKQWKDKYFGGSWPRRYADERGKTTFLPGDTVKLKPAETIQNYFDDEIYQAVHRNRGLQNKRIIFLYCWIPPYKKYLTYGGKHLYKIVEEFDFRKITKKEEDDFFNSLKDQIGNRQLVHDILNDLDYKNKTSTQIASDRKISRKNIYNRPDGRGGPATQYINVLRDGIYKKEVGKNRLKDVKYKI